MRLWWSTDTVRWRAQSVRLGHGRRPGFFARHSGARGRCSEQRRMHAGSGVGVALTPRGADGAHVRPDVHEVVGHRDLRAAARAATPVPPTVEQGTGVGADKHAKRRPRGGGHHGAVLRPRDGKRHLGAFRLRRQTRGVFAQQQEQQEQRRQQQPQYCQWRPVDTSSCRVRRFFVEASVILVAVEHIHKFVTAQANAGCCRHAAFWCQANQSNKYLKACHNSQ
mmetsp:Transcript_13938/g.43407  ORF Transcript_13938/g.43407 Transcript_13938/m.43407 type:complete len:223 (+) Transcript_13938:81-749(+)